MNIPRRSSLIAALMTTGAVLLVAAPSRADVAPLDLVGPVAEYKIYVSTSVKQFVADTKAFTDAVKAGDLKKAQAMFGATRVHYERIEPIAELFSDLDGAIDSRADDHEQKEEDDGFTGFHRIEYGLFEKKSTEGLAPFADKLQSDVEELQQRIKDLTFPPEKVVGGAAALMEEVAKTKISGEEDRYSRTDLYDFQANFDGSRKIFDLFQPLIAKSDKSFVDRVDANFVKVSKTLAKYKTTHGFESYEKLSDADRKVLAASVNTLAEDLSTLRGKLGLD